MTQGLAAIKTNAFLPMSTASLMSAMDAPEDSGLTEEQRNEALKAAQGFESIFLRQLLQTMRASVPKVGMFQDSFAHDMYEQMFDDYLGEELAKSEGLGIAEMIYRDYVHHRAGRLSYEQMVHRAYGEN